MKHVVKNASPEIFEQWKARANDNWQPTYATLQHPEKQAVHESLLREQGWVCCYCGRTVHREDSHIEHFRPQEQRDDLALDYNNMHASCIRELKPATPLHCGHAKAALFDEEQHISPLDPKCEGRFLYLLNGGISVTDETDFVAAHMLGLLKLDSPSLHNQRRAIVGQVFDPAFLATATPEELCRLRDHYRRRDEHGHTPNFGHALARFAEQRLSDAPNAEANQNG